MTSTLFKGDVGDPYFSKISRHSHACKLTDFFFVVFMILTSSIFYNIDKAFRGCCHLLGAGFKYKNLSLNV